MYAVWKFPEKNHEHYIISYIASRGCDVQQEIELGETKPSQNNVNQNNEEVNIKEGAMINSRSWWDLLR